MQEYIDLLNEIGVLRDSGLLVVVEGIVNDIYFYTIVCHSLLAKDIYL